MKLLKNLLALPAIFGAFVVVSAVAMPAVGNPVAESINQANQSIGSNNEQSQVTSVSQLSDVQPTDWAFQALQSLVERYG